MYYFQLSLVLIIFILQQIICDDTVQSLIPLSSTSNAFQRGLKNSAITVELFIDLTCSSCLDSWDTITQVVLNYENKINFLYRIYPLPYHQQAFILSKVANLVNFYTPQSIFTFIDTAYTNQYLIYNSVTADMTYNEVVNMVETWALNNTGLTSFQFNEGMNSSTTNGRTIEMNSRYMFKYCSLHHTFATPLFAINGLNVMNLETYEQWESTLNSLLGA